MQVADLQQFVRNLGTTLQSAGAKSVAGDLEKAAAGLEPFKDMAVAQFSDFLAQAEAYARTGVLPTTGKPRSRAPKAPPEDSPTKIQNATQRVQDLYERAIEPALQYAAIDAEIKSMDKALKKDELVQVARNFGIAKPLKSKKDAAEEILRKINERKESHERTQFRLEDAAPTGVM
jgi:hypothetical protein